MRKRLEQLGTFSFLLMLIGLFSNLVMGSALAEDSTGTAGTPVGLLVLEACIYLGCSLMVVLYYKMMLRSMRAAWPFLLVCLYAMMSTLWSADPQITLRRSAVLTGTTLFGIYLGGRYSTTEFQRILLYSLFVLVAASLLLLLVSPAVVLDPYHRESFRGLTEHKNIFGEYMGEMLLLTATCPFRRERPFVRASLILLAAGMLFWAHSGTALLAVVLTSLVVPLLLLLRFRKLQAIPLTVIAGASIAYGVTLLSNASNSVLEVLGKDSTLTGRADVWRLVWEAILRRPVLGYGFDAFWGGLRGESVRVIEVVGWQVAHSHNGYLELLLSFGFAGSALVLLALVRYAMQAFAYVRNERSVAGLWPIALLLFCLVHAFAEAGLVKRDGLSYLLLVAGGTSLAVSRLREKDAARELDPYPYESHAVMTAVNANA